MFEKKNNAAVAKAAQLLGKKDPIFEAFVETYADLSPSDRDILLKTSMKFLKSLEKYNGNTDQSLLLLSGKFSANVQTATM